MDVYQNHPDRDIVELTSIPFTSEKVNDVDWNNLQKLSDNFGIQWISELKNDNDHPSLNIVVIGKMGKEHNIMYESWMIGNQYVPQYAISYKSKHDNVWWRTSIESALGISDIGWFNFLTKLYMNNYTKLSPDITVKIQKFILERL